MFDNSTNFKFISDFQNDKVHSSKRPFPGK